MSDSERIERIARCLQAKRGYIDISSLHEQDLDDWCGVVADVLSLAEADSDAQVWASETG